jgi:hypothetical protein
MTPLKKLKKQKQVRLFGCSMSQITWKSRKKVQGANKKMKNKVICGCLPGFY